MNTPAPPERPHVVKDAKGKRPEFYEAPGLDQAMSMIMVLAGEVTVLRDRLDAAERVLAAKGIDVAQGIENLVFDQPALEAREARRQDFMERLFYLMRKDAAEAARAETAAGYRQTIQDIAAG